MAKSGELKKYSVRVGSSDYPIYANSKRHAFSEIKKIIPFGKNYIKYSDIKFVKSLPGTIKAPNMRDSYLKKNAPIHIKTVEK